MNDDITSRVRDKIAAWDVTDEASQGRIARQTSGVMDVVAPALEDAHADGYRKATHHHRDTYDREVTSLIEDLSEALGLGRLLPDRPRDTVWARLLREVRDQCARVTALRAALPSRDTTPATTAEVAKLDQKWLANLADWLHEHSECDEPVDSECCAVCWGFACEWGAEYNRATEGDLEADVPPAAAPVGQDTPTYRLFRDVDQANDALIEGPYEVESVRSPGWYEVRCTDDACLWETTGSEPVCEEAADDHLVERHLDLTRPPVGGGS